MGSGLLLLLLLPWGALGNLGGGAGACACTHKWPLEPPRAVRLPHLAPHVLRVEPCPHHVLRFVLPHRQLCGLRNSQWVVELLQLWKSQVAQRPPDRPPATDRPTDRPTNGPTATDKPTAGPPASPMAPLSPPAPEEPPAGPTAQDSSPPRSTPPRSPPAPNLGEGHQALLPTPAAWSHHESVGQDPQMPLPAVGPVPVSLGLTMGLVLLGAGLGLGGVLAYRGGCQGPGRGRGPAPPPLPEDRIPLSCPTGVGPGHSSRQWV